MPFGRTGKVDRGETRVSAVKLGPQDLAELLVIAVPAAMIVKWDHKRVGSLEFAEDVD
jgi:hypothetical protein